MVHHRHAAVEHDPLQGISDGAEDLGRGPQAEREGPVRILGAPPLNAQQMPIPGADWDKPVSGPDIQLRQERPLAQALGHRRDHLYGGVFPRA